MASATLVLGRPPIAESQAPDPTSQLKKFGVKRVVYLFIMFTVAAVGIATLWVQQKRERAHLESSERFLSSLQKISPEVRPVRAMRRPAPRRRSVASNRKPRPAARSASGRPVRMDPARREAARRRVDARRRAQRHAGSRAF